MEDKKGKPKGSAKKPAKSKTPVAKKPPQAEGKSTSTESKKSDASGKKTTPHASPALPDAVKEEITIFQQAPQDPKAKPSRVTLPTHGTLIKPKDEVTYVGKNIKGTRFVCFSLPYEDGTKTGDENQVPLTVEDVLGEIKQQKRNLGMVIDLTCSNRFYNPMHFELKGVKHRKIYCPDRNEIPEKEMLEDFYQYVEKYSVETDGVLDTDAEEFLIGVHCMDGKEKTAYFVCMYMVEKMDFTVAAAIDAFEEARDVKLDQDSVYYRELKNLEARLQAPPPTPPIETKAPAKKPPASKTGGKKGPIPKSNPTGTPKSSTKAPPKGKPTTKTK